MAEFLILNIDMAQTEFLLIDVFHKIVLGESKVQRFSRHFFKRTLVLSSLILHYNQVLQYLNLQNDAL